MAQVSQLVPPWPASGGQPSSKAGRKYTATKCWSERQSPPATCASFGSGRRSGTLYRVQTSASTGRG
eukprot:1805992-Pleurochrysis_carterae.AAC.1